RGLGVIVGVAVLGQYVVVAAEAGRGAVVGLIVVVVVQGGGTCVVGLWLRLGRRVGGGDVIAVAGGQVASRARGPLRRAFAFFAQELAVAQAQDALVHADRIGALEESLRIQAALFLQQGLGVDDDLALAAEVGRQRLAHRGFEFDPGLLLRRRPTQDHA